MDTDDELENCDPEDEYFDPNDVQEELLDDGDLHMSSDDEQSINKNELVDHSIQAFFEHRAPVYSIALNSKIPHMAASGGGDDKSYLWNIQTGDIICPLGGIFYRNISAHR
jgi:WD40 repeat protein